MASTVRTRRFVLVLIVPRRFVNGETRVGIFSIKDIAKEEELTFDYQFERFGSSRQRCYCGSKNCRKFLCAKPVKELISTNKSVSVWGPAIIDRRGTLN